MTAYPSCVREEMRSYRLDNTLSGRRNVSQGFEIFLAAPSLRQDREQQRSLRGIHVEFECWPNHQANGIEKFFVRTGNSSASDFDHLIGDSEYAALGAPQEVEESQLLDMHAISNTFNCCKIVERWRDTRPRLQTKLWTSQI